MPAFDPAELASIVDSARPAHPPPEPSSSAPARLGGLADVEALLRPLEALRQQMAELHANAEGERQRTAELARLLEASRREVALRGAERDGALEQLRTVSAGYEAHRSALEAELEEQRAMLRELEGEAHQRQAEAQAQKALVDGARRELEGARRELEASQKELGALNSQLAERELELGREREGVRGLRAQLERVAADHATLLRALDGAKEAATAQEEKLQRALAEVENQRRAADASRTQAGLLRKKLEASASATEQSLTALAGLREARESLLKEQQRLEEAEKRVTASVEALARTAGVEKGATPAAARVEGKQRRPSLPKVGAPARQLEEVALARGSERPSLIPADAVEEDTD